MGVLDIFATEALCSYILCSYKKRVQQPQLKCRQSNKTFLLFHRNSAIALDSEKKQIPPFLKGRLNLASSRAGDQNPRSGDSYSISMLKSLRKKTPEYDPVFYRIGTDHIHI